MTISISDIRISPVGEDLTTEDLSLSVIRGLELMNRVDEKIEAGISLVKGEWGVLGDDNLVHRPDAAAVRNTYLVFAGTDRFDSAATQQVTLIENSPIIVKTNKYDTTVVGGYHVGDPLTVRSLGTDAAYPTLATSGEPILAKVRQVGDGYLVYEVLVGGATV